MHTHPQPIRPFFDKFHRLQPGFSHIVQWNVIHDLEHGLNNLRLTIQGGNIHPAWVSDPIDMMSTVILEAIQADFSHQIFELVVIFSIPAAPLCNNHAALRNCQISTQFTQNLELSHVRPQSLYEIDGYSSVFIRSKETNTCPFSILTLAMCQNSKGENKLNLNAMEAQDP